MVSVQQVGQEGLPESQGRDDAAQVASARRRSDKTPQPRLGRMGKVLQVRISVAAVRESEHLRAVSPVQVPQQEEPAAVSAEIRRDLLRRIPETRAFSPHEKEIPMTPVSHGKPCAGNPHARFEEGASAPEKPRRNALLHNKNIKYSQNFLTSEKVLNQIIKQLNLKETDTVYEIGTGKGHLTTKLAKISKQVTSIELDSHLFNLSSEKLKLNTRVTLIHQDILQFQFPNKQRYKIVGSIPYHLSTQIIKKVVFESHASDIYLIVEEGFYKRTLDIHRTLGLLLHTQVSIQQLLKLPAECFHPKPKVNSVLIKLTRHTTDVPDKYWKLYTYFVSKWVNREYRQLFTKNQFHQAMKHAKVNNLSTVTYEQVLSIFNSYLLFNGRK